MYRQHIVKIDYKICHFPDIDFIHLNLDKAANLRDSARKITHNLRSFNKLNKLSNIVQEARSKSREITNEDLKGDDRGSTYLEILFMNAGQEQEPVDQEELERKNLEAERDRRLRELRLNLKKPVVSPYIKKIYIIWIAFVLSIICMDSIMVV